MWKAGSDLRSDVQAYTTRRISGKAVSARASGWVVKVWLCGELGHLVTNVFVSRLVDLHAFYKAKAEAFSAALSSDRYMLFRLMDNI